MIVPLNGQGYTSSLDRFFYVVPPLPLLAGLNEVPPKFNGGPDKVRLLTDAKINPKGMGEIHESKLIPFKHC